MGSVAIPSGGGGGNFGKIYYSGQTVTDSYNTFASCGVRATKDNQRPPAVSASGSYNIPLYHNKNNSKEGVLTSVRLRATAYSHYNGTIQNGSASVTVTLKTPSGTLLGSVSKSSAGQNTQEQYVTVNLLGKTALITEKCTYIVAAASSSASAAVPGSSNSDTWTDCSANAGVDQVTYMVEE